MRQRPAELNPVVEQQVSGVFLCVFAPPAPYQHAVYYQRAGPHPVALSLFVFPPSIIRLNGHTGVESQDKL